MSRDVFVDRQRGIVTYVLLAEPMDQIRRIYIDGRPWRQDIELSFLGHSLGRRVDEDGDGRCDALLVGTGH